MATKPTLPTIWHIPDDLWSKLKPLLGREKRPGTPGRPVVPYRTVLWADDKIVEETNVGTVTFGQKVDEELFKAG